MVCSCVILLFDFFTGNLSANPIQELEQRTGRHAITLLVLSLACTPLNNLFRWRELIKRRRALGLYAFLYATIHVIIFVDLDYGLAWSLDHSNHLRKALYHRGRDLVPDADPPCVHILRYLEEAARQKLEATAPA